MDFILWVQDGLVHISGPIWLLIAKLDFLQVRRYIDSTAQDSTCDTRSWKDQPLINACAVLKWHQHLWVAILKFENSSLDNGHSARTHMCFLQRRRQSPCLIFFCEIFWFAAEHSTASIVLRIPWPWNVSTTCVSTLACLVGKYAKTVLPVFWKPFGSSVGFTEGILCHGAHESRTCFRLSAVQCHRLGVDLKSRLSVGHWSAQEECSIPEGGLKVVGSPVARFQLKWWITSS